MLESSLGDLRRLGKKMAERLKKGWGKLNTVAEKKEVSFLDKYTFAETVSLPNILGKAISERKEKKRNKKRWFVTKM